MKILVLIAGSNVPSNSETLADAFIEGASTTVDCTIEKIALRDLTINPFTIACYDAAFEPEADFRMIQEKIQAADGLVFASPIWNFGVPGHFKNLIDRCGSFGLDRERRMRGMWNDKPFYIIFTGGSPTPAWTGLLRKTMSGVKVALQYFGGAHAGTHFEPKCTPGKGVFGLVVDQRPGSLATVRRHGATFAALVRTYAESGKLPVALVLKRRFYKTAQRVQRFFF